MHDDSDTRNRRLATSDQQPATGDQRPATAAVAAFFVSQAPALRSAFATTLACEIALVIVMALHLPDPAWALVTVVVLATPTAGASIFKGFLRLIGTLAGAGLALMLIEWFDQAPLPFSLTLFVLCVIGAYGAAGTVYAYAYLIGLVTVVIVSMGSLTAPDQAVHLAFARACEVGIGVVTALLVRLSVWPVRSSTRLRAELAASLEQGAALLVRTAGEIAGEGPPAADGNRTARDAAVVTLIAGRQRHQTFLQAAMGENDLSRAQHRRHARAVALVGSIIDAVLAAEAVAAASGDRVLASARQELAGAMLDLGRALRLRRARGGAAIARAVQTVALPARVDHGLGDPPAYRAALAQALERLVAGLGALARLTDYLGPGGAEAPAEIDAEAAAAARLAKPPWPDRARLIFGFKVAIVVVCVLWLWVIFHLPAGMQALVSALIVAQHTVGATQLKGLLRLLGCLIGGTAGILVAAFVMPGLSSLGVFCLLIAPILFASAWFNDGSPRYGYVGFQSAFAFVLTLVAGSSPEPNTMAPVLRLCGILIGVAAATIIIRAIAPIDAWLETLRGLGRILASVAQGLTGVGAPAAAAERTAWRDQAVTYIAEIPVGTTRYGWPHWPLDQLLAVVSRLAAVAGLRAAPAARVQSLVPDAAAQLASVAERLAGDLAARRRHSSGAALAVAVAAVDKARRRGEAVPHAHAELADIGILQTTAALLSEIDRVTSRHS
jgi:uncharacterized membrane protein YccC